MGVVQKIRELFGQQPLAAAPKKLPPRKLAPVAEIVEQGLLVAEAALKMSVKNDIIMDALKHKVDYSPQQVQGLVAAAIRDLVAEREKDAQNMAIARAQVSRLGFSARGETEYGREDAATLKHRQEVYAGVAKELEQRLVDTEYLQKIAAKARELAWAEIGESIAERATHPYYSGGDNLEYQQQRDARIADLVADLQAFNGEKQVESVPAKSWWRQLLSRKKSVDSDV